MKRMLAILILSSATVATFGCSMCCGPYDYDYPNMGGKHPRMDPQYGRVGSIYSDPNAYANGPGADSNLVETPEQRPRTSDDLEDDLDFDRYRERLNDDLESIDPLDRPSGERDPSALPDPDPNRTSTTPTASRLWKPRPLRPGQSWR